MHNTFISKLKHFKKPAVLITAILAAMVTGFFIGVVITSTPVKAQTFTKDGVSITLTSEFLEKHTNGFNAHYKSLDVSVFIRNASFESKPALANYTLAQYAEELYKQNNHTVPQGVQTAQGLTFYEYNHYNSDDGITYCYFTYIFKTNSDFWIVQFSTPEMEIENHRKDIAKWAKSVEFE